jgi:hypothetical protein
MVRRAGIAIELQPREFRLLEKLSQAKADPAHVSAAITISEGASEGTAPRPYGNVHLIFAPREPTDLAKRCSDFVMLARFTVPLLN